MIIEGNISVKASLFSPYRSVYQIIVDETKTDRDTKYILREAEKQKIKIIKTTRASIDELAQGKTHGGMLAEISERIYQSINDLHQNDSFIAFLEGIEDPFNFGAIIRALYAAGCTCLITSTRSWDNAASTVIKASAGASEQIKHITAENPSELLGKLKQSHAIVCAMRSDTAIDIYSYDFKQAICICIGGEKRGLSKTILALSTQDVVIPYNTQFKNALSATSASIILAFEVARQRRF